MGRTEAPVPPALGIAAAECGGPQVQRGRGDPAAGVVLRLAERMPGPFTRHPQAHVGVEQPRAGPDHLGAADVVLGPPEPSLAP